MPEASLHANKRRFILSSRRMSRSKRQNTACEEMADSPITRPFLMKLPTETLCHIAGYLDECDLSALCRTNRRLAVVATPVLWRTLFKNALRCKEVLLWAVEVGHHRILQSLLERGVNPNFLYLSSLLRSRLMDLLSAQGRRGMLRPRDDRTLAAEIFRDEYCRSARTRARIHLEREQVKEDWDIRFPLEQIWEILPPHLYHQAFSAQTFKIAGNYEDLRPFWTWTPLHVAVQHGDEVAVHMLLQHGADVNAQCSGLCDCLYPDIGQEDDPNLSVNPTQLRPFWTPLHVAICSGHEQIAEVLMSNGATERVGTLVRQPSPLQRNGRLDMTAIQSAAWLGSVKMCKLFLAKPATPRSQFCNHYLTDRHDRTALLYAAASGHIQTIGKLLLKKGGARLLSQGQTSYFQGLTPDHEDQPPRVLISDPLRLLCMQYRYDDARWLLNYCRPLNNYTIGSPVLHYTRYLAALCFLRPRSGCNLPSLRDQQDRLFRLTPQDLSRQVREAIMLQEIKGSEPHRLSLAKRLLDLGADPNRAEVTMNSTMPIFTDRHTQLRFTRTPLQLAASCGFVKMVKLLITRGAEPDLVIGERSAELRELPLMLAVKQALLPGGNIETVQELLKAGASLEDRFGESVLRTLYEMRPRKSPYGVLGDDFPDWEAWLRIVDMFLNHGAAAETSEWNWNCLLVIGCLPGNLRYCELLEKARSVNELPPATLVRMLRMALLEMAKTRSASTQDVELVRWVLRRYLDTEERLRVPKDVLREVQHQAHRQRLNRITDVIGEFLTRAEAPTVSRLEKERLLDILAT